MKTQKVTKSSKFTQASPNDNEYRDYQNIGLTLLPVASVDDGTNQNVERISYVEGHCHNVNQSSELLLKSYEGFKTQESMHEIQRFSPVERNANRFPQEIEMCNCSANPVYAAKTRFGEQCKSDQTVTLNRSFTSLPKLESSLSQVSLDRKAGKYPSQQRSKHTYVCEQNQRILRELEKTASLRRMQSPEIINIHRGPFYEGHGVENCSIKDFKCDDHGFRRGHSVRTVGSRASIIQAGHPKRRPAGDGMDAEMDDPELMFEMTPGHHLGDCQCACDHVVYSPTTYTTCLQIVGPAEIEILSISNCHGFDDKDLHLRLNVNRVPFYAPMISGNVSLACDLDDKAEISLKGSPVVLNRHGKPADTDNKGLCKLPEKYLYEHSDPTDERAFAPAPDVTRRMGSTTTLGKPEPPGSPPYYRSTSATSSSTNSASSRGIDLTARHWWIIATVLLLAACAGVGVPIALKISSSASFEERLEFATRLLQEVPLIDGHNDLPWNIRMFLHNRLKDFKFNEDLRHVMPWSTSAWSHTDLPRLEQGHVAAQFWAAYVPCESQYKDAVQLTLEQIDVIRRLTEQYHPRLTLCTSSEDIKDAYKRHQLCSLIGVEGGHSLAGSLAVLRTLYHVGVRYLTLTSTCNTPWADCSHEDMPGKKPEHGGLTSFGKSVIKEMNRLGMIVDLSHVSVNTMRDAMEVSKAPVIFSHSSAHALCNSTRNVPDETLRKLALNKGVIMVNFYPPFLTCKEVSTIADAVAHINHIREVAGVDSVGLGAGYDGINYVPQGLEDVSSYPALFAELIGTGKWSVDDLKKLAGLNFLRVFQEAERIRDEFKKANVPPYEDVMTPRMQSNCTSTKQGNF